MVLLEASFSPTDLRLLLGDRDCRGDSYSFLKSSTSESTRDFLSSGTSFALVDLGRLRLEVDLFLGLSLLLLLPECLFFRLPERSLRPLFLSPLPLDVDCRSSEPTGA